MLQTREMVLQFENANGIDLLVYPGFVFMQSEGDLALIDLREVRVTYSQLRFIEDESVPPDAVVVDYTWAKCNKDGSPDRRFANNYQIPVACYGKLTLESPSGLREEYQCSNAETAERLVKTLADYQDKLRLFGDRAPNKPSPTLPPSKPGRLHHKSLSE